MKFEKRTGDPAQETPETKAPATGKKPVIVYIMILFIAAFLLMALSFFVHQRSNTQALGELEHSVSALQEVQATQDQNIQLQKELESLEVEISELESQLNAAQENTTAAQNEADALLALYTLQQQYHAKDYDACRITLQQIQDEDLAQFLPEEAQNDLTSPAQRYQQLKEAVLNA